MKWSSKLKRISGMGGNLGGAWFINKEKKGYEGSGYIQSSENNPKTLRYKSGNIRAEYDIDFRETGTTTCILEHLPKTIPRTDFLQPMDGKQFDYGNKKAYFVYVKERKKDKWLWYTDGGGAEMSDLKVSILIKKKGVQTLSICRRDKGSRVDKIWLTKKESNPQNKKTLPLAKPAILSNKSGGFGSLQKK